jgi:AcrR family transcriptional regulator
MLTCTGPTWLAGAPSDRILIAALESFARDGVGATTIRRVAAEAGVSPGLVQHYFPSKADLRAAVDARVTAVARDALAVRPVEDISERLTGLVADHVVALRYVARAASSMTDSASTGRRSTPRSSTSLR